MPGRYFGGQYDSVKQAAYLDYVINNNPGKLPYLVILDHYTARLRLDILLGGNIILTDAMFFDGSYFQTLFLHNEKREDFMNFIRLLSIGGGAPLIEIRQRKRTVADTLKTMIYRENRPNGFLFSSLSSDYLKTKVAESLSSAQNSGRDFERWDDFLLNAVNYADEEIVKDAIKQKIDVLRYMENLPPNIFRAWEGVFNFQDVLSDAINKQRFRIIRTGDPVFDSVISSIENEITKQYPDRSKLQNEIAQKTRIFARRPTTPAEEKLELLWGQFLQVYNRAIGKQHYCDSFDIGEIAVRGDRTGTIIVEELSQATLQALAKDSWFDFGRKYNNLSKYREAWIREVWDLELGRKSSITDARRALDNLLTQILREYRIRPTIEDVVKVVGGGASIDSDLMDPDGFSLAVSTKIINIPLQTLDLVRRQWVYSRDKANLIEYGQTFEQGI
ncbi:hypothetical protein [Levilinea saccharolytica]|uniref:hypothetical protein n=1 Tax=Levilinea saccharolytica TaxID=229921 RepID=UPI0011BE411C|nr:hypothetical protein [Levilinea saccharolytica]GAP17527.1 hypothetical protein LSAC_01400 [Levilinea saccharolytica]